MTKARENGLRLGGWIAQSLGWSSAPRNDEPEMVRLLALAPRPLIDPRNRMLVVFSPKSACSNVVVWFFHHLGHLQAARDYHPFPHRYRIGVYYQSRIYLDACKGDLTKYRVVRVIRDPFERAASGYRHLLAHPNGRLARLVRMTHIGQQGLSFSDYIKFLEGLDLNDCNEHFALQRHPIEDVLPTAELINVSTEDLFARLNEVEERFGLPRTDMRSSDWVSRVDRRNQPKLQMGGDDLYTTPLFPQQAKSGPWPGYETLLTPDARARLARLYAGDIDSYGIGQKALRTPDKVAASS